MSTPRRFITTAEALNRAGSDELAHRLRGSRERRADQEHDHAGLKHDLATEKV